MKISAFPALLTLIVLLAIGYLAYHLANSNSDTNDLIVGIGTGIQTGKFQLLHRRRRIRCRNQSEAHRS